MKYNRNEFIGWGLKVLMDFLVFSGVDISIELLYYDVIDIVMRYVNENKLLYMYRKKMVVCD